jgi:hypothetical protein
VRKDQPGFAQRRQGPAKPAKKKPRSARWRPSKPLQRGPVQEALIRSDNRNARDITVMQNQARWRRVAREAERQQNPKRFARPHFIR